MAVTSNTYTVGGSGQAGPYSYSFPILADADVKVSVNGVVKTVTTHYTLDSSNTRISFVGGQEPSTGDKVIVYRDTDEDPINSTFVSGSTIRSTELNDNFNQLLYIVQENDNQAMSTLGGVMQGNLGLGLKNNLYFEGDTDDAYETTVTAADPTADRTIILPNVNGTVVTTGDSQTVTSAMIADGTIQNGDIANTTIGGVKLVNDTITAAQIAPNAVTGSELADNAVDENAILNAAVTTAKIANDAVDNTKLSDDAVHTAQLANNAVTAAKIADSQITTAKIANDAVDNTKLADNAVHTAQLANDGITTPKIADNQITNAKIADNQIDSEHYVDGSIDTAHIANDAVDNTKLANNAAHTDQIANDAVTTPKIADLQITTAKIAANAVTTAKIADAELTTLAGMQSATASVLASNTALSATLGEINTICDGKTVDTGINNSSSHGGLATGQAVREYVLAITQAAGGFYPIANELSFPNANPDPGDDAGTVVSIADAGGLVVNGSGVSTTGRTVGGATVTINGIDASLHNSTVAAGKGMLVQTTSTLNTYTYHRLVVDEAGVASAQTLVSDFNSRYQVAGSAPSQQPDGTALADGDLWFDTAANTMKVYDLGNTSYAAVTSVGDYKLLTLQDTDGSTADYSNQSFNLRDGSNAAVVTSAGQLLISVNGVLQKPNAGTSAPSEGFALVDSDTIIFSNAPGAGASVFATLIGSATSVNTPATNSVVEAAIQTNVVSEEKLKISNTGTNGQYLQKQSGNSGGLTWETVVATPTTTRGDIIYRAASADARLAKGTAGQYLKIGANDPEWADVVGAVADGCIFENDQTISNNYTIASGKGAHSVGPITVNATVTVNGNWVVS